MRWPEVAFVGTLSVLAVPASAQSTGLFKEYTALVTPRDDLPIGAVWLPSIGPDGNWDETNITKTSGANSISLNSSLKRQIGLGLGNLLGLNGGANVIRSVKVDGIEIHRVADISKLKINAGQQVLYEGIKARRIELTVDAGATADLTVKAQSLGVPIVAAASGGNTSKVTLDGSNLFLAYQVISLGVPKVKTKERRHEGDETVFDKTHRFTFCRCHENGDVDVRYQNLKAPTANGTFETKTMTISPGPGWTEISLPPYLSGNTLAATSATIRYNPRQDCGAIYKESGEPVCFIFFDEEANNITMRTATFSIKRVKEPSATF